jgi:hypothetical protein
VADKIKTDGELLWRSFSNAVKAGREAEALLSTFETTFSHYESHAEFTKLAEGHLPQGDQWVYPYYWKSYALRLRSPSRRMSTAGTATFAISFWREEDERGSWEGAKVPKFYAAYDSERDDYWDSLYLVLDGNGAAFDDNIQPDPPYLFKYNRLKPSWFFCLPLTCLQNIDDLKREIFLPFFGTVSGQAQEVAFSGAKHTYSSVSRFP